MTDTFVEMKHEFQAYHSGLVQGDKQIFVSESIPRGQKLLMDLKEMGEAWIYHPLDLNAERFYKYPHRELGALMDYIEEWLELLPRKGERDG